MNETMKHYDMLVEENNDPVCDSDKMKSYMNKWDGHRFIKSMELSLSKNVLEIGVGTGRIPIEVAISIGIIYCTYRMFFIKQSVSGVGNPAIMIYLAIDIFFNIIITICAYEFTTYFKMIRKL